MKKILSSFIFVISLQLSSQTIQQANELIEIGEYDMAIEMLQDLVDAKPKDSDASYALGLAWLGKGNRDEATKEFLSARKKGSRDANYQLAIIELERLETKKAADYITEYRKLLKKAKKGTEDLSVNFDERHDKIENMLESVEKVIVIDSIQVDTDGFFKYYALSKQTGKLLSPTVLDKNSHAADPTIVFESGDGRERIWAIENNDHIFELVSSSILYGDKWEDPVPLGIQLNEGGDANFPFIMDDGITMYFANDGENSVGGYDIFLTRRDGDNFLEPTNIGFPFNSLADDYMLVIDEAKGMGWWATNRNSAPDSVIIYTFIPNEIRTNYPDDEADIASLARLDSYKKTWGDEIYSQNNATITETGNVYQDNIKQFRLNVPGKGIYTDLNDFRNLKAKGLMQQYVDATKQLEKRKQDIQQLREKYRKNSDNTIGQQIINEERNLETLRLNLSKLRNQIITLETT